jgi:site-specific DNA-methyltransferase (cytosine-N4-specific)
VTSPAPEIIQGDARALPLLDESVDLIVTSPPYFGLRDYRASGQLGAEPTPAEFIAALIECTREMARVLKPSGSIFVNLGDKYASGGGLKAHSSLAEPSGQVRTASRRGRRSPNTLGVPEKSLILLPERYRIAAVDELGLIARAVIVWSKPNGLPESVTDRVRRSHEDWVHLTKSRRYFAAIDEIREPVQHPGRGMTFDQRRAEGFIGGRAQRGARERDRVAGDNSKAAHPLGKLPGSVWTIPTQALRVPAELGVDHFAAFPMEWPRRLIRGWSPEGGTVLDPFGGTGTAALVAVMNGRRGISVDLNPDYCRLAEWRAQDPKQRAKAAGGGPA